MASPEVQTPEFIQFLKEQYNLIGLLPKEDVIYGRTGKRYKMTKFVYRWNIGSIAALTTYSVTGVEDQCPTDLQGNDSRLIFLKDITLKSDVRVYPNISATAALNALTQSTAGFISGEETVDLDVVNVTSEITFKVKNENPTATYGLIEFTGIKAEVLM